MIPTAPESLCVKPLGTLLSPPFNPQTLPLAWCWKSDAIIIKTSSVPAKTPHVLLSIMVPHLYIYTYSLIAPKLLVLIWGAG